MNDDSRRAWPDGHSDLEIFWTLVSLLAMEPEQQLRCIGEIPRQRAPEAVLQSHSGNPLSCFVEAVHDWTGVGLDALHPNTQAVERLRARLEALVEAEVRARRAGDPSLISREGLEHGRDWQELRNMARQTLEAAGETARPVPEPVAWGELVEFQT